MSPLRAAQIGIASQEATDALDLTVREAVAHFAAYYPNPRRIPETLELVGLAECAPQRVRLLSGGQRRRLDVAIGIVGRPRRVVVIAAGRVVADGSPATLGGADRDLATVAWLEGGERREIRTSTPGAAVAELAARLGADVPGLTVTRPTLEDIYLRLSRRDCPVWSCCWRRPTRCWTAIPPPPASTCAWPPTGSPTWCSWTCACRAGTGCRPRPEYSPWHRAPASSC